MAFTTYNGSTPADLVRAVLAKDSGILVRSAAYRGSTSAASFYNGSIANLGAGAGILLSTGDAIVPLSNTVSFFTKEYFTAGDSDLDNAVRAAFGGTRNSTDAAVLEFTFEVTDPSLKSISFNVVFGSEEFPEYSDRFVDIAAVFVNGTNVALLDGDPTRPLSVTTKSIQGGGIRSNSNVGIEYDGLSTTLSIVAPLNAGINRIKIAIGDTGDNAFDSGVFVSDIAAISLATQGLFKRVAGTGGADKVDGSNTVNQLFDLGSGSDELTLGSGKNLVVAGADNDTVISKSLDAQVIADGGAGNDTWQVAADFHPSLVQYDEDGTALVGGSKLINFENVKFNDETIQVGKDPDGYEKILPLGAGLKWLGERSQDGHYGFSAPGYDYDEKLSLYRLAQSGKVLETLGSNPIGLFKALAAEVAPAIRDGIKDLAISKLLPDIKILSTIKDVAGAGQLVEDYQTDQFTTAGRIMDLVVNGGSPGADEELFTAIEERHGKFVKDVVVSVGAPVVNFFTKSIGSWFNRSTLGFDLDINFNEARPERIAAAGHRDVYHGNDGIEAIRLGDLNDFAFGAGGADKLYGEAGNDILLGGDGNDLLEGGSGNDFLKGGLGENLIRGGDGIDTLSLASPFSAYSVVSTSGGHSVMGPGSVDAVTGIERVRAGGKEVAWSVFATTDGLRYIASHPDLIKAIGADAGAGRQHFFVSGQNEGRNPAIFDAIRYAASNPDLIRAFGADETALTLHYIGSGFGEGRRSDLFDAKLYGGSNPDLLNVLGPSSEALTRHYVVAGAKEGRPTRSFDALQYGASNPDLARAFGTDTASLINHFVTAGFGEKRPLNTFSPLLYAASNKDVALAIGTDPIGLRRHYLQVGADEGRSVSSFNPLHYSASHTDLAKAFGTNADALTRHYVEVGIREGRSPAAFDIKRYAASNPDLIVAFRSDDAAYLRHYVENGLREGRQTKSFDPLQYAAVNPDLARAFGTDQFALLSHFIAFGHAENRPRAGFDIRNYAAANPDVFSAFGLNSDKLLGHYISSGLKEGRSTNFDALRYAASNPDLARAFGSDKLKLLEHFVTVGFKEGRSTTSFDPFVYGASNLDVARAFGPNPEQLTLHFLRAGLNEGRRTASFDPVQYGAANPEVVRALGTYTVEGVATHYIRFGAQEGRKLSGFDALTYGASNPIIAQEIGLNPSALAFHYVTKGIPANLPTRGFDPIAYAAVNTDVLLKIGLKPQALTEHYLRIGADERRKTSGFDPFLYKLSNLDLMRAGLSDALALDHWLNTGAKEGRPRNLFGEPQSFNQFGLPGGVTYAVQDVGDLDWYLVNTSTTRMLGLELRGAGYVTPNTPTTMKDGFIRILDFRGNILAEDDNSGPGQDAWIRSFTFEGNKGYYVILGSKGPDIGRAALISTQPKQDAILRGTSGNDVLNADANSFSTIFEPLQGSDRLRGSYGKDTFFYNSADGSPDRIENFVVADDALEFWRSGFGEMSTVNLVKGTAPAPKSGSPVFLYNTTTGAFSYDPDGTGAKASIEIARLVGAPDLQASNIKLSAAATPVAPSSSVIFETNSFSPPIDRAPADWFVV